MPRVDAGVGRLVLVSSLAAVGPAQRGTPLSGDPVPRPVTAYGRSKLAGEHALRDRPVPWTILRPPTVYGPRDREVLKVFKLARTGFVRSSARATRSSPLCTGPTWPAPSSPPDPAPATVGKTYYPAHPAIFTSGELVRTIGRAMGRSVRLIPLSEPVARAALTLTEHWARLTDRATLLNTDKASEFFQPAWTCDPSSLTSDTGWKAEHDLPHGVEATLRWYRQHQWL